MRLRATVLAMPVAGVLVCGAPAEALDVRLKNVAASGPTVHASFDIRDVLPGKFKDLVDEGGTLHLRVQAELWERRPVWDRLVYPATVRVLRLVRPRAATGGTANNDIRVRAPDGSETPLVNGSVLPLEVAIGSADRLTTTARYYLRIVATVGTLAEREIDNVGDAVFGTPDEANALGTVGRMLFSGVLQLSDYLQSVSAEIRSSRMTGRELLRR